VALTQHLSWGDPGSAVPHRRTQPRFVQAPGNACPHLRAPPLLHGAAPTWTGVARWSRT